jgi:uncharacterized SAM-binding protein YcdF (DUF218 family)
MIRTLIIIFAFIAVFIFGIGFYLQPDDLLSCDKKPSNVSGCKAADAIVAISGGDTTARVNEAVGLFKNGWSDKIIFSGAAKDKTGPSNAAAMRTIALKSGVPEDSIFIDEYAETTKQNAQNSQNIFSEMEVKSVILVTSGYHQRRATLEFNKHSSEVKVLSHPVKTDKDWSIWWWLTPRGWWLASGELVKIIAFYTVGV